MMNAKSHSGTLRYPLIMYTILFMYEVSTYYIYNLVYLCCSLLEQ